MRIQFRKAMAAVFMVLGPVMIARGVQNALERDLGWQGVAPSLVVGALVFALGFARWRFWRQR